MAQPIVRPAALRRTSLLGTLLVCTCLLAGCGTLSTLDAVNRDSPLIFGGTRLNLDALHDPAEARRHHHVAPPALPALDLPLSAALDAVLLPYTVASALSRALAGGVRR